MNLSEEPAMKKDKVKNSMELTAEEFPYSKENEEMVTQNFLDEN